MATNLSKRSEFVISKPVYTLDITQKSVSKWKCIMRHMYFETLFRDCLKSDRQTGEEKQNWGKKEIKKQKSQLLADFFSQRKVLPCQLKSERPRYRPKKLPSIAAHPRSRFGG
jgi:hypothetical protein